MQSTHNHARSLTATLPTTAELAIGTALGCNMAWVSMSFKSMGFYASYGHGESLLDAIYLVSIVTVALTLLLAGAFDRATGMLLERRGTTFALPLGVAVSTLIMPLAGLEGAAGEVALFVAGALSGLFSGLFLFKFGMVFSLMTMRSTVIGAASGSIVSALLFVLFLLFSPFEACVFAASMPLVASVLLEFGKKGIPFAVQESPCSLLDQHALDDAQEQSEWKQLVAKLAACSLLVGFANEAARTLYVQMGIANTDGTAYALAQSFAAFGVTVGIIVIALGLLSSKTERMAKNCYHALVLLLVGGVLLLPLPLVYPSASVHLPHAVNAASYTCFGMFMWVIITAVCGRYQQARVRTFGFVRAAWAIGPLLGMLLGRYILHVAGLSIESAYPVMLASTLILLLVSGLIFSESDLIRAMDIIPLARKQRFRTQCLKVIEKHGLSEREGEIMIMFAKGRNLPYVQEHLYLSKSTVSTHRQHIYQKLDIHTQQELMDLVEAEKA